MELSSIDVVNRPQGRIFGLAAFEGHCFSPPSAPRAVVVACGGVRRRLPAAECMQEFRQGDWRLTFHLVSHLLPNGEVALNASVEFAGGETAVFPGCTIVVENDTSLAALVSEDLRAAGVDPVVGRTIDSALFPYASGHARTQFDRESIDDVPMLLGPAPSRAAAHRHLQRWGFVALPDVLPSDLVDRFVTELEGAISSGHIPYTPGSSERIHGAHTLPSGREIWLHRPVLEFLREHFEDTPCACQTLTYIHGSQQDAHQDTIHLTPYPAGLMAGVWIALQDVEDDSGELFVYPGSHVTPRLRTADLGLEKVTSDYSQYHKFSSEIERLLVDGGYSRQIYRPKRGEILIWHENLIHGGSYRKDPSRRRLSIVSHYFAKGGIAFYDARGEAATLEPMPE